MVVLGRVRCVFVVCVWGFLITLVCDEAVLIVVCSSDGGHFEERLVG